MSMNYELLLKFTKEVPYGLNKKQKKEQVTKNIRKDITERDKLTCQLCGYKDRYGNAGWDIDGNLHIHHIIPNGTAKPDNLITLCKWCHSTIHLILYREGKWRYIMVR